MKKANLLFILTLFLAVTGSAATYTIDPSHSSVHFTIRHIVSKVSGTFNDFEGKITTDEKNPNKSSVATTIKTTSIDTKNKKRDDHLRSEDFFDASKFPEIKFVTKKVSGTDKKFKIEGVLTMHGVEKPVTLDAQFLGKEKDPWGKERAGFTGTTKVNRKDFNITYNKTLDSGNLLLGDEVTIDLNLEAVKD